MLRIHIRRPIHKHPGVGMLQISARRSIGWLAATMVAAFATASVLAMTSSPLPPALHAALATF